MVRRLAALALATAALSVFPHQAAAQLEQTRSGVWFTGGLGYGSLGCGGCGGRVNGWSGGLGIGGTINSKVLLGAATHGWSRSEDGVTLTVGTLTALLRFYPSATGGFFLLGGIGYGSVSVDVAQFGSAGESGAGAVLGLGYDFRVGRNVSLTPFWNGVGISTSDADANFGQIGLGVTVH